MTKLSPLQEAHACRIWGIAKEHNWKITQKVVADILGLDYRNTRRIISAKGWNDKFDKAEAELAKRRGGFMRKKRYGGDFDENSLDLVDLIGGGA